MNNTAVRVRASNPRIEQALIQTGQHPLLARLLAARGVEADDLAASGLQHLLPPQQLLGIDTAAETLADALEAGARIVVAGDYDCDGATATAVGVRGLRMLLQGLGATAEQAA